MFRDQFVYAPSQWDTTLHCNIGSHWLGAYTKWSLHVDRYFSPLAAPEVVMMTTSGAARGEKKPSAVNMTIIVLPTLQGTCYWSAVFFHWLLPTILPGSAYSTSNTSALTHWGRVMHICVSELTSIGSDNGLLPGRRQAIIWNNAGLLLIEPLGTNFSEISFRIQTFSFKKMPLNVSSAKWPPFCLGLNVLTHWVWDIWRGFADIIIKCIFLNENVRILVNISLKSIPKGHINNIPALVQIMACCLPGDKPLSEPMMASLQTYWHIYASLRLNELMICTGITMNHFTPNIHWTVFNCGWCRR